MSYFEAFNDDQYFRSFGEALIEAHNSWTEDWDDVTDALLVASQSCSKIADCRDSAFYEQIAQQLQDASDISGCVSIGPAASVPNLESITESLLELARLEQDHNIKADNNGEKEHDISNSYHFLVKAAEGFLDVVGDFD